MAVIATGDLVTATALSQIDSTGKFTDSITIGLGTNVDKTVTFDKGSGASNPKIKYNSATNGLEIIFGTVTTLKISTGTGTVYHLKFDTAGDLYIAGKMVSNEDIT